LVVTLVLESRFGFDGLSRCIAAASLLLLSSAVPAFTQNLQAAPPQATIGQPRETSLAQRGFRLTHEVELMAGSQPYALALDPRDGAIWFTAPNLGAIGRIDPETRRVSYTHLGKRARPWGIAFGGQEHLYITDRALNCLHRLDAVTGELTRIAMPAELPVLDLAGIRADGEGHLWFAGAGGWLGKHDPQTGQTEVRSHDDLQGLSISVKADDGGIWFAAWRANRLMRVDSAKGRFDSTALPEGFRGVRGMSVSPQGEIWVSAFKSNAIARFAGRGTWRVIPLPWPDSQPQAVLVRRDGTVLVADGGRRLLLRYRAATNTFDEIAPLGEGGAIKSMIETRQGIAIADWGGDDIRLFNDSQAGEN
jgi:streptogramin lyase